jgi:hypothetical protein
MRQLWANFINDDFDSETEWETWRGVFNEEK